jgi:hypothetical protein
MGPLFFLGSFLKEPWFSILNAEFLANKQPPLILTSWDWGSFGPSRVGNHDPDQATTESSQPLKTRDGPVQSQNELIVQHVYIDPWASELIHKKRHLMISREEKHLSIGWHIHVMIYVIKCWKWHQNKDSEFCWTVYIPDTKCSWESNFAL